MTKIFQTLEDRGNADQVEAEGPFLCTRNDAWLGTGYYFWESFINNAHWWGKSSYESVGYIICESTYTNDSSLCLDLINNAEHINLFQETIDLMQAQGLYRDKATSVARIIEFLRKIKAFPYIATRASGINSRNEKSEYTKRIIFNSKHPGYIDLCPQIQICFYTKNARNRSCYRIIYPSEYIEGYVV